MENYATANRNTNLARGRLGGAYLFTKDTPVLGRRAPSISAHHQPSPLATSSTALNGSGNYLAPPTPQYQQLPQVTSEFELVTPLLQIKTFYDRNMIINHIRFMYLRF